MRLKIIIITGILFSMGLFSCTSDFEEINTNPNAPLQVQPSLLLRQVIYDYGEEMSYEGFAAGNLLGQHLTALDFNLFDRHALKSPQLGGNPWPVLYTNLRDNEIILSLSREAEAFKIYEGPALILKAYMTSTLTDLYGDVPYFEAFKGKEVTTTPAYDAQEDIYLAEGGILHNFDKGISAIENYQGAIGLEGDILFNGNLEKWLKFANSLKIKSLMRISAKMDVSTELQQIYTEGNFIQQNSENAAFDFTDGEPNNFRMARLRAGDFNNFVMSETIDEILETLNDPRGMILFRPTGNNPEEYNGLINGIDASQTSISPADFSYAGRIFREDSGMLDANFLTAWEISFLLAEAAEKGFIAADAKMLYERGVTQAFEYWNSTLPENYLQSQAAYDGNGNDKLKRIITQKWIAGMTNGYEGWIEWRRTGFPNLKNISASLNNNIIPVRLPYPTEEAALNSQNYQESAAATDGNSIDSPVWWDEN
ncbi:SusD/RagB family nutrient-binding outer membrane lipoprotein [Salegentibacter sp. JZCK2]|uniref:SusD/RagB family nutrient-binding outer membrane lipoprotein n=1 Tax=Salegentibacter tibetensis TaxID=2873600 RepID=UPI001CD0054F|nr:SusD/RagB family nutrient-binding outer membrane lipoprotein [Salegentibacter tibetensis]MBZ9731549.1 SusD/RagB family nutrient-binding outer membrane lipoprotein [Salegentibacter tibetensis]